MKRVLIKYAGNLSSSGFLARALEGKRNGSTRGGCVIVVDDENLFLSGNEDEVNAMISGFPEAQSFWKAVEGNQTLSGGVMQNMITLNEVHMSETFRSILPDLQW